MLIPRKQFKDVDDAKAFLAKNSDIATANMGMMVNCVVTAMEQSIESVLSRLTVLEKMQELEHNGAGRDILARDYDDQLAYLQRYRDVLDVASAVKEIMWAVKAERIIDAVTSMHR